MNTKFIWAFTKFNGLEWIHRSPFSVIANVVMPLSLLFIIVVLSGGRLLSFVVVGGVIAIVATGTLTIIGQSAMFKLEFRLQELLVATRINVLDYILGFAFAELSFTLPGIAFFTILSILLGLFTPVRFLTMLAVVLMLAIATTSIAVTAGTRMKRMIGVWPISGIMSNLLTLIPPTFYPYTVLPKPLLYLLAISPVTPAAVTLQGVYGVSPAVWWSLPLLVFEVLFYIGIARAFAVWRER